MIQPFDIMHPEDAEAMRQMKAIPGFEILTKKFLEIGAEQLQYGINVASNIKLSPSQLPEIYNRLPPICKKLGIEEPEFYLTMDPIPNAWTFGDTRIFITITSGLVELLTTEELDAVIAHEAGHCLLRHVLYHSIAMYIKDGLNALGTLGNLAVPVELAFCYWQRKSELSADRVAAYVTSPKTVASVMARLAGGPLSITRNINYKEWARQADTYEEIRTDGTWNKTLQAIAIAWQNHPFAAVRVNEILKWAESEQYKRLIGRAKQIGVAKCPDCGTQLNPSWNFCNGCGKKLKK